MAMKKIYEHIENMPIALTLTLIIPCFSPTKYDNNFVSKFWRKKK